MCVCALCVHVQARWCVFCVWERMSVCVCVFGTYRRLWLARLCRDITTDHTWTHTHTSHSQGKVHNWGEHTGSMYVHENVSNSMYLHHNVYNVCMYTHTHRHNDRPHLNTHTHTHTHNHPQTHTNTHEHTYTNTHTLTQTHTHMGVREREGSRERESDRQSKRESEQERWDTRTNTHTDIHKVSKLHTHAYIHHIHIYQTKDIYETKLQRGGAFVRAHLLYNLCSRVSDYSYITPRCERDGAFVRLNLVLEFYV